MMKHKLSYTFDWEKHLSIKDDSMMNPCDNVFYYTTTDTFKKIIENGCLFASHIKYMNDWQEFNSGYEYIANKMIERLENYKHNKKMPRDKEQEVEDAILFFKQGTINGYKCAIWDYGAKGTYEFGRGVQFYDYCFPQVYNISFTTKRDLLSQWKMYARESGIAIEFDFTKNNFFAQKVNGEFVFGESVYPQKVIYNLDEELNKIEFNDCEEEVLNSNDMIRILEKVPFIKNSYYKAEDEYRLLFRPYTTNEHICCSSEIKFREANHVLIPYLEMYCLDNMQQISWPIISLTIGPGNNQDVVFSSVIYFVENIAKNIYCFTVADFLKNFERFYEILIGRIKDEAWRGAPVSIKKVILKFKQEVSEDVKLYDCYSKGKFRSTMEDAKKAIYSEIKSKVKDEDMECVNQVIAQFESDYYLASNGIIIQKSKAPYIFN